LDLVSKNKKSQIKQSIKAYSKLGELTLHLVQDSEDALKAMNDLMFLHQKHWRSKGLNGSFSNSFFKQFHDNMMKRNFDRDKIHLIKIMCGDQVIGVLYNFIHQRKVHFYQCGFDYQCDNKLRPGLVSHYLAIEHYAQHGYERYDFMTGESRYKVSLSTDHESLFWIKVQRKKFRFYFEHILRIVKAKLNTLNKIVKQ
jgi:CelD/BcsL family acetyltransferase involved in cellulose biosynthesis